MIVASTEELLDYLADLLERMERFAVSAVAGDGNEEIAWLQDEAGQLVMDVQGTLPAEPRAEPAELVLRERWRPERQGSWRLRDYGYELRHRGLDYRRALHYHDETHFVRAFGVATHEHCEPIMGRPACDHYGGDPVRGAIEGFERLYAVWLTGERPDCSALRCLG